MQLYVVRTEFFKQEQSAKIKIMRKKKVVLDYTGLKDDELNTLTGKVLDCLDGHTSFVDLPVDLADLEVQVSDFRKKWQIASGGGSRLEIAEKNDAKALVAISLRDLAFYVNKISNGSHSMLLSSGLLLEAEPKGSQVPDQLTGVGLVDGKQKGQMQIKFKPLKSASLYEYEIAKSLDANGEPEWNEVFQTGSSQGNVYLAATPDVVYYMRARARNKKGIGDWSDVMSLRAR